MDTGVIVEGVAAGVGAMAGMYLMEKVLRLGMLGKILGAVGGGIAGAYLAKELKK